MLRRTRTRGLLLAAAVVAAAIPALAQDRTQGPPTQSETQPAAPSAAAPAQQPATRPQPRQAPAAPAGEAEAEELGGYSLPPPPVEIPEDARRDPTRVGRLDPAQLGLGADPWGASSGALLSSLMRRLGAPQPTPTPMSLKPPSSKLPRLNGLCSQLFIIRRGVVS